MRLIAERPELKKAQPPRLTVVHRKAAHPRKPKGLIATYPGQFAERGVGVDAIEIHCPLVGQRDGQRRYISTSNCADAPHYCGGSPRRVSLTRLNGYWRLRW